MFSIFRPYIFSLDPEAAHDLAIKSLKFNFLPKNIFSVEKEEILETNLFNQKLPNPIGLAAGFDKSAEVYNSLFKLGYGFVEVGTITPRRQLGNPKPRIFRLEKDQALINRLGFNNHGSEIVSKRIANNLPTGFLGINIGPNKDSLNKEEDYFLCLSRLSSLAGYITINISSPNTENLRELSARENIEFLMNKISKKKAQLVDMHKKKTPIFVKLSPDETEDNLKNIIHISEKNNIDGFICCNTTTEHSYQNSGGMSGAMLTKKAENLQKKIIKLKQDKSILIASGGVMSAEDVKVRLTHSADLVQLYTGYIYQGNSLLKKALIISSS